MVSKKELDEPGINSEQEVRVFLKVTNAKSNVVLLDTSKKGFLSTYDQVAKFISTHGEREALHLAEYGTEKSLDSPATGRRKKGNGKHWNSIASTTVSTIPADSDARLSIPSVRSSISSDASGALGDSKGTNAARPNEPVLMSTKITEEDDAENLSAADVSETETKSVMLPKDEENNLSQSTLPNGSDGKPAEDEQRKNGVSLKEEKLIEEAHMVDEKEKKSSEEPAKTPSRAQKRKKVSKSLSDSTSVESSSEQAPKRQKKQEQPFDTASDMSTPTNTNGETSMEVDNTSSGSACTLDPSFYYGSRLLDNSEWEDLAKSMCVWGSIGIGEWVFARWRDKNYYSGKISKRGHNDTWHIDFEDEMSDVASEAHILPLKTIGVGAKAVYSPDNVFKPAIAEVVGQKLSTDAENTEYAIKCEGYGVTILCKRRQLSLKESVAKELRKHYNSNIKMKAADVSFENILPETKRRPRGIVASSFDASAADESVFKDSGVNTPTPKKRIVKRSKSTNKTDDSNSVDGDSAFASSKDAVATTPKAEMQEKVASKETPKASNKNKEAAKKPKNENELFEGYQFMLTASGGGDPNLRGNITIAYDKDEFRAQIEAKGGEVVDVVGREGRKKNVFLISDSYARTVKYIYCLAAGIPCVSYLWISDCLKEGKIVDWKPHQLSSGLSLERNEVIPYHSRKPLKGLKLYVTAETDELYNYWKPVLMAAGATLLKPMKNPVDQPVPEDAEVVVTDHSCSLELFEHTVSKGKPIVMPEWLVQSIITGERASFDGHERYQVSPSEYDEEED